MDAPRVGAPSRRYPPLRYQLLPLGLTLGLVALLFLFFPAASRSSTSPAPFPCDPCLRGAGAAGAGHGLRFDGVDDYVEVLEAESAVVTDRFSLSVWIYATDPITARKAGIIINKENEYEIARLQNGTIQWAVGPVSQWGWYNTGYIPPLNQWIHLTLVFDLGAVDFYVNGESIAPTVHLSETTVGPDPEYTGLRIGSRQYHHLQQFSGIIDEVRVWAIPLTQEQIQTEMAGLLEGPQPGLIAYWPMDEGSGQQVADVIGPADGFLGSTAQPDSADGAWETTDFSRVSSLVYLAFDNNLSPHAAEVLERLRVGSLTTPGVRVTALVDEQGPHNSYLAEIEGGDLTTSPVPWTTQITDELDSASPEVLADFLKWGRLHRHGVESSLALLGHGMGPLPPVHALPYTSTRNPNLPPLPQERDLTSFDVTSHTYLSTPDLGDALREATNDGQAPFTMLFLDQCFQGNLDVLYEIHKAAKVFVASPNYAWAAFPYDLYLQSATIPPPDSTQPVAEFMGQRTVEVYQALLDDQHPNAIFWIRQDTIVALADTVSALGGALREAHPLHESDILDAALASRFADTTLRAGDLELEPPDELIGLGSFAHALQTRFPTNTAVYTLAGTIRTELTNVHGTYRIGQPWVHPTTTWRYSDTFTILAPLTPTLSTDTIWRASIYTESAPFVAAWGPDPTQHVTITRALSSTLVGQWDDFIAAWYGPLAPTFGAVRGFPALNLAPRITDSLPLTVQVTAAHILLNWGEPVEGAARYALYVHLPDTPLWEVLDFQPGSALVYRHSSCPLAGDYSYFVAAWTLQGEVIARSESVTVHQPSPCLAYRLHLPLVMSRMDEQTTPTAVPPSLTPTPTASAPASATPTGTPTATPTASIPASATPTGTPTATPTCPPIEDNQPILDAEAAWIATLQVNMPGERADGAIVDFCNPVGDRRITPDFASRAATGLLAKPEYAPHVRRYLEWYMRHLNWPDYNGLKGTVYDYYISPTGEETVVMEDGHPYYESSDRYAASFIHLLRRYYEVTGDAQYLRDKRYFIEFIGNAMRVTQQPDGLTWARPDDRTKYMINNADVYAALADLEWLALEVYDDPASSGYWRTFKSHLGAGIEGKLWSTSHQMYRPYLDEADNGPLPDWAVMYPDALAQMVSLGTVVEPASARAEHLYSTFNLHHPDWPTPDGTSAPNALLAQRAMLMGDRVRATTFLNTVQALFILRGHPLPWYSAESGYTMLTARALLEPPP